MKANVAVSCYEWMKQSCIQGANTPSHTHIHTCNKHAAELEMTDINTHQPPLLHTHMHMLLSWDTCQSSDSALRGFFMVGYSRVGGGGFFFCWRTNNWPHAHHPDSHTAEFIQQHQSEEMKTEVIRLSHRPPLFISVMSWFLFSAECKNSGMNAHLHTHKVYMYTLCIHGRACLWPACMHAHTSYVKKM